MEKEEKKSKPKVGVECGYGRLGRTNIGCFCDRKRSKGSYA